MRLRIVKSQKRGIERAMIAQEVPLIARRLRADFPQTTAKMTDAEVLTFTRACADQALALENLRDVEQVYRLAAVNTNLARIEADPVGRAFFDKIAGSPDLEGGKKIDLLYRNLARYFEAAQKEAD